MGVLGIGINRDGVKEVRMKKKSTRKKVGRGQLKEEGGKEERGEERGERMVGAGRGVGREE